MPRLHLKLLGGFEARIAPGQSLEIATRKTRALLAFLALPTGRAHSRDKLAGLLWSDRGDEQARNSLRQAIAELGRNLASLEPSPLVKGRDTLALNPHAVEVDALIFERLARSADLHHRRAGTDMYGGELLAGFAVREAAFEEWLRGERQRLHELAIFAFKKLLDREAGELALATAQRLLALDALQEEGHRVLMRLYAEAGEMGAALRQYDTCRETLMRELGVAPSTETEALHKEIRGRTTGEVPRAGATALPLSPERQRRQSKSELSIAVLPFTNMSGDPEQQYFSDGITEDIITALSRFPELSVIARHSSFHYRDKSVDVRRISRELGAEHVVQGSLRKTGNRVRITAQLVEAALGSHLWAENYDRELKDIFATLDEVTHTIVATLVGRLVSSSARRASGKPTAHWGAYDLLLQARECLIRFDLEAAELLVRRAIKLDPKFTQAHALQARIYLGRYYDDCRAETLNEAFACAQKAMSLNENDGWCQCVMGSVYLFMRCHDLAGAHIERAIALNPNNVYFLSWRANWLARVGRSREALENLDVVRRWDPFQHALDWAARSVPLLQEKRYEEVVLALSQISQMPVWVRAYLTVAYSYLGRDQEARAQSAEILRLQPDFSIGRFSEGEPWKNPADREHVLEGLRRAGLPE